MAPAGGAGDVVEHAGHLGGALDCGGDGGDLGVIGDEAALGVGEAHPPQAGHHRFLDLGDHPVGQRHGGGDLTFAEHLADQGELVGLVAGEVEQETGAIGLLGLQRRDQLRQQSAATFGQRSINSAALDVARNEMVPAPVRPERPAKPEAVSSMPIGIIATVPSSPSGATQNPAFMLRPLPSKGWWCG